MSSGEEAVKCDITTSEVMMLLCGDTYMSRPEVVVVVVLLVGGGVPPPLGHVLLLLLLAVVVLTGEVLLLLPDAHPPHVLRPVIGLACPALRETIRA